jgi:hypothetical protein
MVLRGMGGTYYRSTLQRSLRLSAFMNGDFKDGPGDLAYSFSSFPFPFSGH